MFSITMISLLWMQPINMPAGTGEKVAVVTTASGCDCGCPCCKSACCGGKCQAGCCDACPCSDGCCANKAVDGQSANAKTGVTAAAGAVVASGCAKCGADCNDCCGGNCESCCGGNCGGCCGKSHSSRG